MDLNVKKELITVVVPCYNEEQSLPYFYDEISKVMYLMREYDFEIIGIDDGSKDNTLNELIALSNKDNRVKYISFSRNFGKEAAIYAGLSHAKGDYVVMMDADLQDPPSLLPEMMNEIQKEGIDSVATRRVTRKGEPPIRSFFACLFYKLMHKISQTEIVDGARDYRLMTRQFVDSLLELSEYNRFSKGLFGWVGYRTTWLEFENVERVAGETKWSFWKLFKYSIEGIVAFSTVPLAIAAISGVIFCMFAFIFIIIIVVRTLLFGDPVAGWPSMICIILLIGGIQLLSLGILGEYLAKTYLEVKNRPIYICKKTNIEKKE
ncbi:MAG: glycosyltransferase family 2 protein [Erysipelotrichaceae bacterium]|nr:glycosyltransferase family 2 protein [Erysipelotrichaceae bacterium]